MKHLLMHNIDTLGADIDPGILGYHIESRAALTTEVLTAGRELAEYFEACAALHPQAKTVANWVMGEHPIRATALGGLSVVAPLHDLGAWLFLSFFVLHAYLVTTGRTPGEHLRAMTTGYRSVAAGADPERGA